MIEAVDFKMVKNFLVIICNNFVFLVIVERFIKKMAKKIITSGAQVLHAKEKEESK
jgi:hypothetical protein